MSSSRYQHTAASLIGESVEDLQSVQAHLEVIRRLLAELALLDRRRLTKLCLDPTEQPFVRAPLFNPKAVNQNQKGLRHAAVE